MDCGDLTKIVKTSRILWIIFITVGLIVPENKDAKQWLLFLFRFSTEMDTLTV